MKAKLLKVIVAAVLGSGAHEAAARLSGDQVIEVVVSASVTALAYWMRSPKSKLTDPQ